MIVCTEYFRWTLYLASLIQSTSWHSYFSKIRFNIIIPSTSTFHKWAIPFRLANQIAVFIPPIITHVLRVSLITSMGFCY
jgi:hypothetical protein